MTPVCDDGLVGSLKFLRYMWLMNGSSIGGISRRNSWIARLITAVRSADFVEVDLDAPLFVLLSTLVETGSKTLVSIYRNRV